MLRLATRATSIARAAGVASLLILAGCGDDDGGEPMMPPLGENRGAPVQVSMSCRTLSADSGAEILGTAVKQEIFGSLANGSALPTPGVISECDSPDWDTSVTAPKVTTYGHDGNGRVLSVHRAWGDGPEQPGITESTTTNTFEITETIEGEPPCGQVLEKRTTDANGNTTSTRACTENGFHLSRSDAAGRRISYQYDAVGLTTRVTNPNGSYVTQEYYHVCPIASDGSTPTCPDGVATACPHGDQTIPRNCMVETQYAGTDPATGTANSSFMDGYARILIKDGLARIVAALDNRGGSGYGEMQTRQTREYDDLGLVTTVTDEIGVATPIIYRAKTTYDAKLRPLLTCDARAVAHEWVHDDVGQHRKLSINGHQQLRVSANDGQKLTATHDCPIVGEATTSGEDCPTVSADASTSSCSGNVYVTDLALDGAGIQRSVSTFDPNAAANGASIESTTGTPIYSAERMKHGFIYSSTATAMGQPVSATTTWKRDLLGNSLGNEIEVRANTIDSFASSSFTFDAVGNQQTEESALGAAVRETIDYSPTRKVRQRTMPSGQTLHNDYDSQDRLVRHCYPTDTGSAGEILTRDALTGDIDGVTSFTNSGSCTACDGGDCGDVLGDSVTFTRTPFGAVDSKTYSEIQPDGSALETLLQWSYDEYQRPKCFADAAATMKGSRCPSSPTPPEWEPAPEELLTHYTYWPDSDPYRRGFLHSACRGLQVKMGASLVFETQCLDTDYYTSADSDGVCGVAQATGALANLVKSKSLCAGGSCLDGTGTLIYQTVFEYDGHRRVCSVESRTADQTIIQASTYTHDQYDNVIVESHSSELGAGAASNYAVAYQYDGMMRVVASQKTDPGGNPLESVTYEYDAASNLASEVRTITQ
jgi:YD repeat-containing protein